MNFSFGQTWASLQAMINDALQRLPQIVPAYSSSRSFTPSVESRNCSFAASRKADNTREISGLSPPAYIRWRALVGLLVSIAIIAPSFKATTMFTYDGRPFGQSGTFSTIPSPRCSQLTWLTSA